MNRILSGRTAVLKFSIAAVVTVLVGGLCLLGARNRTAASAFGPSPTFTGAPSESNCTVCHGDFTVNEGDGSVEITGVPLSYTPGQTYTVTVKATQADAVIYGFQLTAIDSAGNKAGAFDIPAASKGRLQILTGVVGEATVREYIEHTSGGLSNGQFGFNSWVMTWTAPATNVGRVDFYAAANCANSDGNTSGDYIYTSSKAALAPDTVFVSVGGEVTTPAGLPLRNAKVVLTDPTGAQTFATTSSFGLYSFTDLPSGTAYTLSVQSKRYRFTARSITPTENLTDIDFAGLE